MLSWRVDDQPGSGQQADVVEYHAFISANISTDLAQSRAVMRSDKLKYSVACGHKDSISQ